MVAILKSTSVRPALTGASLGFTNACSLLERLRLAVTWTNHDDFTHNEALPDGSAPLTMSPGASVSHTFDSAGEFAYMCSLHPRDMRGRVVVTPA
jgi:hypothetical protein